MGEYKLEEAAGSEAATFFGDERDEGIREEGWVLQTERLDNKGRVIPFQTPSGLESVALEPHHLGEVDLDNYLVYDPTKAEVQMVLWPTAGKDARQNLKAEGWKIVDSNILRGICVRTKPQST